MLDEIQKTPQFFAVPDLFFNEMLSVFCRLLQDTKQIQKYLNFLEDLGLQRIGNGRELLLTAVHIAKAHNVRGCDAIYIACAELTSGIWLTADLKAHKQIADLKLSKTLA